MINLFDKEELQKGIHYLAVNHSVISKLKNKYAIVFQFCKKKYGYFQVEIVNPRRNC